jgi:hypothetical protein
MIIHVDGYKCQLMKSNKVGNIAYCYGWILYFFFVGFYY